MSNSSRAQDKNDEPKFSMQTYYFVFLNDGPNHPADTTQTKALQEGHMNNMMTMFKTGKLKLSGPFMKKGTLKGIFILDVASETEARDLLSDDPEIAYGSLTADILAWYGPKGLTVIPDK